MPDSSSYQSISMTGGLHQKLTRNPQRQQRAGKSSHSSVCTPSTIPTAYGSYKALISVDRLSHTDELSDKSPLESLRCCGCWLDIVSNSHGC